MLEPMVEIHHILLKLHNCNLNICELRQAIVKVGMILGQAGLKMILVGRYDHRIYFGRKETMLKRNRISPIVENTQILIFEFE
jgi:hypothetical protein